MWQDRDWGLREPDTIMLLPFLQLNQEKSFFAEAMRSDSSYYKMSFSCCNAYIFAMLIIYRGARVLHPSSTTLYFVLLVFPHLY